jgi:hypothetical protein
MRRSELRANLDTYRDWQRRSAEKARVKAKTRKSKSIPRRNAKRAAESYERNFGDRAAWIRQQPCLVRGVAGHECNSGTQAAHSKPRRMGGRGGNRRDLVPLCALAHDEAGEYPGLGRYVGTKRWAFETKYSVNLVEKAAEIAALLDTLGYE